MARVKKEVVFGVSEADGLAAAVASTGGVPIPEPVKKRKTKVAAPVIGLVEIEASEDGCRRFEMVMDLPLRTRRGEAILATKEYQAKNKLMRTILLLKKVAYVEVREQTEIKFDVK